MGELPGKPLGAHKFAVSRAYRNPLNHFAFPFGWMWRGGKRESGPTVFGLWGTVAHFSPLPVLWSSARPRLIGSFYSAPVIPSMGRFGGCFDWLKWEKWEAREFGGVIYERICVEWNAIWGRKVGNPGELGSGNFFFLKFINLYKNVRKPFFICFRGRGTRI